jgi:hypothetical protein
MAHGIAGDDAVLSPWIGLLGAHPCQHHKTKGTIALLPRRRKCASLEGAIGATLWWLHFCGRRLNPSERATRDKSMPEAENAEVRHAIRKSGRYWAHFLRAAPAPGHNGSRPGDTTLLGAWISARRCLPGRRLTTTLHGSGLAPGDTSCASACRRRSRSTSTASA